MLFICDAAARCLQTDGVQVGEQQRLKTAGWLSRRRLCGYPMGEDRVPQTGVDRGYGG
jgi:hypothetical protein